MSGLTNKLTGQIGEYLVCAKLGKLGLIATPFAGNVPTSVCVNSIETTWLRKLGSTLDDDGEALLQSERSPWTTHEFIAFWNSVAGMVRVRAGLSALP